MAFHMPNQYRVHQGPLGSQDDIGNNGLFIFPLKIRNAGYRVRCIAGEGAGWQHVSVSLDGLKIPSWEVMCAVRDLFWGPEDCVMQLHPPHADYVNDHPAVLHLWRPIDVEIPRPPQWMV